MKEDKITYLNKEARQAFYEREILREVSRLLSAMDRCPVSSLRGCLDREYWAWATKDFANIDLQRGLRILAYVYKTFFENNSYHSKKELLTWISMGVQYWIAQVNTKAFNHLYVHEGSWMAAAFGLV